MKIAICIVTYKRPIGLARLLSSLEKLSFVRTERPQLEITVIENDPSGAALELCRNLCSNFKWPLTCSIEPKRGISFARNKAIESVKDSDFIAFIDDDEVPDPNWLDHLLAVQEKYQADVVTGATLPHFSGNAPEWIQRGGFFNRKRHSTGETVQEARTSNVLLRRSIFDTIGGFDERFALTGGEDTQFFARVHRAGYKIVWADEAVVHEWIPESRMNTKWILKRAFRIGITDIMSEREFSSSIFIGSLIWTVRGLSRISKGLLRVPFVFLLGRHEVVKSLQAAFNGAGTLAGIMGINYEEYRKTHGQ